MRTNPHSFQGLGEQAIDIIKNLKKSHDFNFVSEITDPRQIEVLSPIVDIFQVGTRNMYNYELLERIRKTKPADFIEKSFFRKGYRMVNGGRILNAIRE